MTMLPMFPRYRANGTHYETLQKAAIALGHVTLNHHYEPPAKPGAHTMDVYVQDAQRLAAGTYERPTIFSEIVAVPEETPEELRSMYERRPGQRSGTVDELAAIAVNGLRRYIAREWVEDDMYIMPHSSGYDSRLISALLREMRTGNLFFMSWQPEQESTRQLLKRMDFPADRLMLVGEGTVDYQAPALDFLTLGSYQSDAERFIVGPSLAELQLDHATDNWVSVTASFSDETSAFNVASWPSLGYFHAARLLDSPRPWPSKRWMMPFVSREHLEFLTTYRIPCSGDDFKRAMIRHVDPGLEEFPNQRFEIAKTIDANGHHDYAHLSDDACKRMMRDYMNSWYFQRLRFEIDTPPWGSHDDGVREYIKAAICEYLRVEGVEIVCV